VLEACLHWGSSKTAAAMVKLAVLLAVAACFSQPAEAYRPARRRPVSRPMSEDVQPTPEIEAQVAEEVAKVRRILDGLNADNLLASPYLVSTVYYHDGFLSDFPVDRTSAAPERRIIGQITSMLSLDRKARFVELLHEIWARSGPAARQRSVAPVDYSVSSGGRRTHRYAVDLFAPEGASVRAVSRGVVVLADRDWSRANLFSTTSRKGGNAVIVFDPDHDRFYRYCHMGTVLVSAGGLVAAGQIIGNVGHSGLNASQAGHGHHLHFETNEYLQGHVQALDYRRLRTMLREWRATSGNESALGATKAQTARAVSKR